MTRDFPIGQRISLPGHFPEPVVLESVRSIGAGYECRVRLADGTPDEAILSLDEANAVFGQTAEVSTLNREEYDLYKAVTAFIKRFLPQASGRKKASVALARTVLQRRLASSTYAICESIRRRLERQENLLKELEELPPSQLARRLAQLQGRLPDAEQDEDDLDDETRDRLVDEVTGSFRI